ncbi:Hypothetical predicted protein [Scomber scombrus]|uniref:Uncharacterized protein n=1 Tax=Scomber scombrus TaxID=13677 RepID=A0AAV1MXG9_SCOSC
MGTPSEKHATAQCLCTLSYSREASQLLFTASCFLRQGFEVDEGGKWKKYSLSKCNHNICKRCITAAFIHDLSYFHDLNKPCVIYEQFPPQFGDLRFFQNRVDPPHSLHSSSSGSAHGVEALCIEKNKLQRAFFSLNRITL